MNIEQFSSHVAKFSGVNVRQIRGHVLDAIVRFENKGVAKAEFDKLRQFCRENFAEMVRPEHLLPLDDEAQFHINDMRLMISVTGGVYSDAQVGVTIAED